MRFLAFLFALLISLGASAQPVPGTFGTFTSAPSPGQLVAGISLTGGSFNSGAPTGTVVDVINVSMAPVGPPFAGSLSLTGTDAASFQLSGSNLETQGSLACRTYSLNIVATQTGIHNSPFSIPTTVTCTPIVQTISNVGLSGSSFNSGAPTATVVGAISVGMSPTSPAFAGTLSLSGASAASFQLSSATLAANLETNGSLACTTYTLNIVATQIGATGSPFTFPVTVTCTPPAQTLAGIGLTGTSFNSGASTGTVVGGISVSMSPTTPAFAGTLSITGADAASFQLSSPSIPSNLETNGSLACSTYHINLVATQVGATGSPLTVPVTITCSVTQVISSVNLSNASFNSGAASGTVVGAISVPMAPTTPAFSGTLSLTGTNAGSFQLSSTGIPSNLETNGTLACTTYSLNIVATQGGIGNSPVTTPITVTCTPVVQTISAVSLGNSSFNSGAPSGTTVGAISVSMSPTTPAFSGTLSLTGTNAGSFQLSSVSIPSNLQTNGSLACATFSLNIVATQGGATGSPFTQPITVTCTPAAQTISGVTISASSFNINAPSGTVIGSIDVPMSPSSPAFSGTLSLSGTDAASFSLSSVNLPSNLATVGALACRTYSLNLVATQAGATGSPKTVPISVTCNSTIQSTTVTFTGVSPCTGTAVATSGGGTSGAITCPTAGGVITSGTTIATIAVSPVGWVGSGSISAGSGSYNSTSFSIGGTAPNYLLKVGASNLTPGGPGLSGVITGLFSP